MTRYDELLIALATYIKDQEAAGRAGHGAAPLLV